MKETANDYLNETRRAIEACMNDLADCHSHYDSDYGYSYQCLDSAIRHLGDSLQSLVKLEDELVRVPATGGNAPPWNPALACYDCKHYGMRGQQPCTVCTADPSDGELPSKWESKEAAI